MSDLMQKLMVSKAIMDKHNQIPRGQNPTQLPETTLQEFSAPQAKYNIPTDLVSESSFENTKELGNPSVNAIKNSKLPDSIKKLMMENPIVPPQQPSSVLSDELIEKASRLMGNKQTSAQPIKESKSSSNIDLSSINKLVKQAVNEALRENGLLVEETEKTNESFSFRVGSHIFEGKVTKVKKIK